MLKLISRFGTNKHIEYGRYFLLEYTYVPDAYYKSGKHSTTKCSACHSINSGSKSSKPSILSTLLEEKDSPWMAHT